MSPADILALSRRYVEARDEVARLKRKRFAAQCERECAHDSGGLIAACWKMTYDKGDPEVGLRAGWEHGTDPDEWCDACKRRQAIHEQIRPAQRRLAGRMSALIAATRRAP